MTNGSQAARLGLSFKIPANDRSVNSLYIATVQYVTSGTAVGVADRRFAPIFGELSAPFSVEMLYV